MAEGHCTRGLDGQREPNPGLPDFIHGGHAAALADNEPLIDPSTNSTDEAREIIPSTPAAKVTALRCCQEGFA